MTLAELLEVYEFKGSDSQATFENDEIPADITVDEDITAWILDFDDISEDEKFIVYKKGNNNSSYTLKPYQFKELLTVGLKDVIKGTESIYDRNIFSVPSQNSLTQFPIIKTRPADSTQFADCVFQVNFGYKDTNNDFHQLGWFTVKQSKQSDNNN